MTLRDALADGCKKLRPSVDYLAACDDLLKHLQHIVSAEFKSSYEVRISGSHAQRVCLDGESLDVALIPIGLRDGEGEIPESIQLDSLCRLTKIFQADQLSPICITEECTAQSLVLCLKFGRQQPASLTASVMVGNTYTERDDEAMGKFLDLDKRSQLLVLLVKHWANRRRLCDASKGC